MVEDKPSSHPSPKSNWITRPVGYLSIALLASLFSVGIYAASQFAYQRFVLEDTAEISASFMDNPARAETPEVDKGILIKTANSFREIAQTTGKAVVSIKTTKEAPNLGGRGIPRNDPFFEFFERFGQPMPFPQQQQPQQGLGSGFVISRDGYIVTNNHVVEGATEIILSPAGSNKDYKAEIVGTDPKSDLAVLRVEDSEGLPEPAKWADSDKTEVGDWAIAIGNPFGLGTSVTVGIISAKGGRNSLALTGAEYARDLLQTDAAINPGNSGGPLTNLDGDVMGVNTAIYTRSGGYMGIGFAIPSNLARYVVEKLISDGKVVRGWLGVYIQPLEDELARELGVEAGVGIHEVIKDGPAESGGLRAGDVVTSVNGQSVSKVEELQSIISRTKPGDTVKMTVVSYRNKNKRTLRVKIGELPTDDKQPLAQRGQPSGKPDELGLVVGSTTKGAGVVIEGVAPNSPGAMAGLQVGDIILSVNRKKTNSVKSYNAAASKARGRIYMEVRRKGRRLFFQFTGPRE